MDKSGQVLTIDMHNHWLPETYLDEVKKGALGGLTEVQETEKGLFLQFPGPEPGKRIKMPFTHDLYSWDSRLKEMDETGIDMAVVAPAPQSFHYLGEAHLINEIHQMINNNTAEVVTKESKRLKGLANVCSPPVRCASHPGDGKSYE